MQLHRTEQYLAVDTEFKPELQLVGDEDEAEGERLSGVGAQKREGLLPPRYARGPRRRGHRSRQASCSGAESNAIIRGSSRNMAVRRRRAAATI